MHKGQISTREASKLGISPRMLSYYAKKGQLVRLSQGIYCFPDRQGVGFVDLVKERLAGIEYAVIGLKSAVRLYGLAEEIFPSIDLLVPETRTPKRKISDVVFHRVKNHLIDISVVSIHGIRVTSLERTLVDLLRCGESLSFVLEVFREARAKKVPCNLALVRKLGVKLRAKAKTEKFLEAVL